MLTVGDRIPSFDLQAVISTEQKKAFTRITDLVEMLALYAQGK